MNIGLISVMTVVPQIMYDKLKSNVHGNKKYRQFKVREHAAASVV
jgi:hypothetical protein